MGVTQSVTGIPLTTSATAIPCGAAAKYYFNDFFTLYNGTTNQPIEIKGNNIAWESDKEKYKNNNLDR